MIVFNPIEHAKIIDPRLQVRRKRHRCARANTRAPLLEHTFLGGRTDGYRIEKLIGVGSFSLVYSAVEVSSGLSVVIKEYFPKHYARRKPDNFIVSLAGKGKKQADFFEGAKRFYNEALILKLVVHPNILDAHDVLRANSTAYLVSQNRGGRDLKWFLSSTDEPMAPSLIIKIFLPILSALHFLHDAQLMHLDVKPGNILLQPNAESLLLDFGAAQLMSDIGLSGLKRVVTHGFSPPEQYCKHAALGAWADVYAVGATLYYCLTGKAPAKSIDQEIPTRLQVERYRDDYPAGLIHTINRALSYEISERFQSIDGFAAALLDGSPWSSLADYERKVMGYDRSACSVRQIQDQLVKHAA